MAKDNIDQPHMHLMFSERAIDEKTRALSEEQFFNSIASDFADMAIPKSSAQPAIKA